MKYNKRPEVKGIITGISSGKCLHVKLNDGREGIVYVDDIADNKKSRNTDGFEEDQEIRAAELGVDAKLSTFAKSVVKLSIRALENTEKMASNINVQAVRAQGEDKAARILAEKAEIERQREERREAKRKAAQAAANARAASMPRNVEKSESQVLRETAVKLFARNLKNGMDKIYNESLGIGAKQFGRIARNMIKKGLPANMINQVVDEQIADATALIVDHIARMLNTTMMSTADISKVLECIVAATKEHQLSEKRLADSLLLAETFKPVLLNLKTAPIKKEYTHLFSEKPSSSPRNISDNGGIVLWDGTWRIHAFQLGPDDQIGINVVSITFPGTDLSLYCVDIGTEMGRVIQRTYQAAQIDFALQQMRQKRR